MNSAANSIWKPYLLFLGVALLLGGVIGLWIYNQLHFLPGPDAVQLACAADHLAKTGEYITTSTKGITLNYTSCWTTNYYTTIQYITAQISQLLNNSVWATISLAIGLYTICILLIGLIVYRLTNIVWLGIIASIMTSVSMGLLRSLLVTPHNLYGYVAILLCIALLVVWRDKNIWWQLVGLWSISALSATLHQLSFAILAVAVSCFTLHSIVTQKKWWLGIGCMIIGYFVLVLGIHSWNPLYVIDILYSIHVPGIQKPWYDSLAILGYLSVPLAIIGAAQSFEQFRKSSAHAFLLYYTIIVIAFRLAYLINITILPERVIAYLWPVIIIWASLGLYILLKNIHGIWHWLVMTCLLWGMAWQGMFFIISDIQEIKNRYLPSPDFIAAAEWLEQNRTSNNFVMGINNINNRQIQYAGLYYKGDIIAYPWSDMDFRDITKFTSLSTQFQSILSDPTSKQYLDLYGLYMISSQPTSPTAQDFIKTYGINYMIIWKPEQTYTIWQKTIYAKHIVYENQNYVIYAL